ncbi:hypothetical protein B0A52_05367 [Exophiala mesophila]|uniref:Large ribosomal subunit protein uL23m n=1 Tax=Exophiala mesophila TaxID=212818 RepID=A0A438N4Q8_EXOME|nr:hypothetical protein B0A52_05367 [Exophiala mesophila]
MPRASRVPPRLVTNPFQKPPPTGKAPRLWNAKRRIPSLVGLSRRDLLRQDAGTPTFRPADDLFGYDLQRARTRPSPEAEIADIELRRIKLRAASPPEDTNWWQQDQNRVLQYMQNHPIYSKLSLDVQTFILANPQLDDKALRRLMSNPPAYFRTSRNVPLEQRQQVYFPPVHEAVILLRTPNLSPNFACFEVPLRFNKLDMRDYLKSAYDVDVLQVRSYIHQTKDREVRTLSKFGAPRFARIPNIKKMTVQLVNPFVWPEEITDLKPWDHEEFWRTSILSRKEMEAQMEMPLKADSVQRAALKREAKSVIAGKSTSQWKPTWHELHSSAKVMDDTLMSVPPPRPQPRILFTKKSWKRRPSMPL